MKDEIIRQMKQWTEKQISILAARSRVNDENYQGDEKKIQHWILQVQQTIAGSHSGTEDVAAVWRAFYACVVRYYDQAGL